MKERPDSLTARALLDRARRELLRGRRREKLEERVRQARDLFESSEFAAAERIVTSALKLIPNHPVALELFGKMRQRRLLVDSAEALAERELDQLARGQARQAFEAAREALAGGWERKAILALRRGLRLVPDDPSLLGLIEEVQSSQESLDRERARRRALLSQVRAGLELLAQGELTGSLKILRAVLREEPDNLRAQAAIQEVRRVWLLRRAVAEAAAEPPQSPARDGSSGGPASTRPRTSAPVRPTVLRPPRDPESGRPRPGDAPPRAPSDPHRVVGTGARPSIAAIPAARSPGIAAVLPPRRRGRTPLALTVAGAAVFIGLVVAFGRSGPAVVAPSAAPTVVQRPSPDSSPGEVAGPLARVDVELRRAIEERLAAYGRALETADENLLSRVRPDLTPVQRGQALAPFVGALNAASDLRVVDVTARGDEVLVSVVRTDIIVLEGGKGGTGRPIEERLRFQRRDGEWVLR